MRAEEIHSRVRPEVKTALIERANREGKTVSSLIARVLTQTVTRWNAAAAKENAK